MNTPFEMPCVILCGGKSSRMGEDKALLPFSSSNSLAQYQYDRLKPYFKNTYISSKANKFDFDAEFIFDKDEVYSPIIALKTILENIESQEVFIITVDTPLVSIETISKLIKESKDYDITVAQAERIHNLCGVFNKNNLSFIEEMLIKDIHKIGYLLKNNKTNIVNFPSEREFINLNRQEDYAEAKSLIR